MGYAHIINLYRPEAQQILLFKELYAMEKIHGTSTHISWKDNALTFFSGGCKHDQFCAVFNAAELTEKLNTLGHPHVTIYGEGYGGKCQGMSATYGKALKFVAFEVKIGEAWLSVPDAEDVCTKLGLEFVSYTRIPCTIEAIDAERDKPSVQAQRNGIQAPMLREGVVLRPLVEMVSNHGRVMAKHKRAEFSERLTIPSIDPTKREYMLNADKIANEWVTEMRLKHVLDKLPDCRDYKDIPTVIAAMLEDVHREAKGEIAVNNAVNRALSGKTVKLFKSYLRGNNVVRV